MPDGSGRLFVLLTESFAVRALLGSLAAAALAAVAVRFSLIRSFRARRLLILTPVLTAATAAVVSFGEGYLPQLWITTTTLQPAGPLLDFLGELRVVAEQRRIDLLLLGYGVIAGLLLSRRLAGFAAARRVLVRATEPIGYGSLVPTLHRLAASMRIRTPRIVLIDDCPGGAFTVGTRRPTVAVDPALIDQLDERELEGLLAHELAHIRRRDPLLGTVVGVAQDLAFFLPPIHVAMRWLRREQEESADELASGHTHRPGALASSILKVWDSSRNRRALRAACAAIPVSRRLALADAGDATPRLTGPAKTISMRVQRLIDRTPAVTPRRLGAELTLAGAVACAAVTAALGIPAWLASEHGAAGIGVSIGSLSEPSTTPVESPAIATFRALTAERAPDALDESVAAAARGAPAKAATAGSSDAGTVPGCPCVQSQGELRRQVSAVPTAPDHRMVWSSDDYDPWVLRNWRGDRPVRSTRPLWTMSDTNQQVGVFLIGPAASASG